MTPSHLPLLCVLAAACAAPAPQPVLPAPAAAEFPGAAALLAGFDPVVDAEAWHDDDAVLYGLRLQKGEQTLRWLLRLEVLVGDSEVVRSGMSSGLWDEVSWTYTQQPGGTDYTVKSLRLPVIAALHGADGQRLGASVVKLPVRLLGRGLLGAAAAGRAFGSGPASAAQDPGVLAMVEATLGMIALLDVVQHDDVLAEYFWQVVEKPSVWSVLGHLGVSASIQVGFDRSRPTTGLPAGLPPLGTAEVVPLAIDVNGSPALRLEVTGSDPRRPYALGAGIVAATARHPSRDDVRFEVRLLAARRGETRPRPPAPAGAAAPRSGS